MIDYYSFEELDAMPVGTGVPDEQGNTWYRQEGGGWSQTEEADYDGMPSEGGWLVKPERRGTAIDRADIQVGDVICAYGYGHIDPDLDIKVVAIDHAIQNDYTTGFELNPPRGFGWELRLVERPKSKSYSEALWNLAGPWTPAPKEDKPDTDISEVELVINDPEVKAIAGILLYLKAFDKDAQARIIDYITARYTEGEI
jgi:hypothetical protein